MPTAPPPPESDLDADHLESESPAARPRGLRRRVTRSIVLLAVGPLLLFTLVLAYPLYDIHTTSAMHRQDAAINTAVARIEAFTQVAHTALITTSSAPLDTGNLPVIMAVLAQPQATVRSLDRLELVDSEGVVVAARSRSAAVADSAGTDRSDHPAFSVPLSSAETYFGPVELDTQTGEPYMAVGQPVFDRRTGSVASVLIATLRLREMWNLIDDLNATTEDTAIYVVDEFGQLVGHPDSDLVLAGSTLVVPDGDGFGSGLTGARSLMSVGTVSFGDRELHVVAETTAWDALAGLRTAGLVLGLIVVGGLLTASAWGTRLARSFVRPIEDLADTARSITAGDLSARAAETAPDELGVLEESFNEMADRVQRSLADQQAAAKELRRSNAELEQFAYVASHDLQEPLRMVASYTDLLARRYEGQLDADADEFIGFAKDGASRMQVLISDLLTYSRVNGNNLNPTRIDLDRTVAAIVHDLDSAIEEAGVAVAVDPLPTIEADASLIRTLFQNLISNAVKFSGDQDPRVEVSAHRENGLWEFRVSDNGIGIPQEHHDRVFAIFQRLHSRESYSGSGIGLAICKRVVDLHDGNIRIDSSPGRGTTMRFTLRSVPGAELSTHSNSINKRNPDA